PSLSGDDASSTCSAEHLGTCGEVLRPVVMRADGIMGIVVIANAHIMQGAAEDVATVAIIGRGLVEPIIDGLFGGWGIPGNVLGPCGVMIARRRDALRNR